jgi:hypothetical protein
MLLFSNLQTITLTKCVYRLRYSYGPTLGGGCVVSASRVCTTSMLVLFNGRKLERTKVRCHDIYNRFNASPSTDSMSNIILMQLLHDSHTNLKRIPKAALWRAEAFSVHPWSHHIVRRSLTSLICASVTNAWVMNPGSSASNYLIKARHFSRRNGTDMCKAASSDFPAYNVNTWF